MSIQLTFLGGTQTVTGSKYLLSYRTKNILIDCGLFQGYKELRLRNWDKFPFNPHDIHAVILSHAHLDHSGYLPLLVKNGFKGKIYCTPGTYDLCSILLPDSGYLQEEEARLANKYGFSKHHPALPLYTQEDAKQALQHFELLPFDNIYQFLDDFQFYFGCAGHIVGAAMININVGGKTVVFSGDIGRPEDPVMLAPTIVKAADYLIIESTYGNRLHDTMDPKIQMARIINETMQHAGSVIIPAFAVGRAQTLLYYIDQLKKAGEIADVPVFLDSPMAASATNILQAYQNETKLTPKECEALCKIPTYIDTPEESKLLDTYTFPKIIISSSGMAEGGRILHHLKTYAPDHRNTILFTGYQAGGTRGAKLIAGHPKIKIHGQLIPVNAHIEELTTTSAHADYQEILNWLSNFNSPPLKTFITHGEPEATEFLKTKIEKELRWKCEIPIYLQTVLLK